MYLNTGEMLLSQGDEMLLSPGEGVGDGAADAFECVLARYKEMRREIDNGARFQLTIDDTDMTYYSTGTGGVLASALLAYEVYVGV